MAAHRARAQQPAAMPTVGVLRHAGNAGEEQPYFDALTRGFKDLGYVEGRTIKFQLLEGVGTTSTGTGTTSGFGSEHRLQQHVWNRGKSGSRWGALKTSLMTLNGYLADRYAQGQLSVLGLKHTSTRCT
jgi:hypothetical protein